MTDISVIIVNYNVKHFLRQCIESVIAATHGLAVETIVVDNTSVDGSVQMLHKDFPDVRCIENTENVGFSKANNQGLALAEGKYVLLLNPDTILQEDTLVKCFEFAEQDSNIGAIGVKMLDGSGSYLPESKRGFPTAAAAFGKITGLYKLFRSSSKINAYYAGHIDKDTTGFVDVLCGAFMFMQRSLVNKVGGLDEDYWMYGEDIDLSYQIQKAGYQIAYLPTTSIIHYKGESTKKSTRKYNTAFYGAMQIFLSKHFTDRSSKLTLALLKIAVIAVGVLSYIKHIGGKIAAWSIDVALGLLTVLSLVPLWAEKWHGGVDYFVQSSYLYWIIGIVIGLMVLLFVIGHYDDDAKRRRYVPTVLLYGLTVLVFYSLLPEQFRFSRVLVVLSSLLPGLIAYGTRLIRNRIKGYSFAYEHHRTSRLAIVGEKESIGNIESLLGGTLSQSIVARIAPSHHEYDKSYYLTNLNNIQDVCNIMEVNEVIYCSRDLSMSLVFSTMSKLGAKMRYRIANQSNQAVLGSDSKDTLGKWYTEELAFNINSASNLRLRRLFDIIISLVSLLGLPYLILRSRVTRQLLGNIPAVLVGKKTWFGYQNENELPQLKPSVFNIKDHQSQSITELNILNLNYAKHYSVWHDVTLWINLIIYG